MKRMYLLGDSIRLGYQPLVTAALVGRAVVDGPSENCESSRVLRSRLSDWAGDRPDVVHVNCGLHDVRYDPGAEYPNVDITEYEANVEAILSGLQALGIGRIVWASTTPVDDSRNEEGPSRRWNVDIDRYNAVARTVAERCGAEYNDLHGAVRSHGTTDLLHEDGVHLTRQGYGFLASRVVDVLGVEGRRRPWLRASPPKSRTDPDRSSPSRVDTTHPAAVRGSRTTTAVSCGRRAAQPSSF